MQQAPVFQIQPAASHREPPQQNPKVRMRNLFQKVFFSPKPQRTQFSAHNPSRGTITGAESAGNSQNRDSQANRSPNVEPGPTFASIFKNQPYILISTPELS